MSRLSIRVDFRQKLMAKFWTPDGEFVDADGKTFRGRTAIDKEFTNFFNEFKGLTL